MSNGSSAKEPVKLERLNGCARCHGEGHDNLEFVALTYPVECNCGELTHWCPCPTNGEPILMLITETAQ